MPNPKILIVEDEAIVAKDLQKRLLNLGYDVIGIAATGEEALRKAATTMIDLVLMDVRLKGEMDGIQTANELRLRYHTTIVYLTAYADNDTLRRASATEPFGYVLKPFEERELHTTIEMALYRAEIERRFKENETWYGTTLRSIGEAVIATDTNGAIKFMNTAAESLTGWKLSEAAGEDLLQVFRTKEELSKPKSSNPVEQILKNKIAAVLKNHAVLISRDGRETPVDENASPIKDEHGKTVGVVLVFQDVSERRRAQEALKTSQDYARSIVESSLDMVIAVDLDRKIIEFNKAAEETFGYKKEEVLGQHINILYADASVGSSVNQTVNSNGHGIYEVLDKRKNGEIFPCLISSAILQNARGEKIGYMGTSRDITEVKRAEERLKAAQDYSKSIINSSLDMIIASDQNRIITEFNHAAEETFGYTAEEVIGQHVNILYADLEESTMVHNITVKDGRCIREITNRRKNGKSFPCLLSSSVLKNSQGETIGVMGISRDITERKQVEQSLRESEERYRSLIELSPDPTIVHIKGQVVFANSATLRAFGAKSIDEVMNRSIVDFVHPDYKIKVLDRVQRMHDEGLKMPVIEEKFLRFDGTIFEAEVAAMPFTWNGQQAIQVVMRDITERRKAEQFIRVSEAKYRSLIENVMDGVYQTTPDGDILTVNPAVLQILGYQSEAEVILLNVEKDLYADQNERDQFLEILHRQGNVKNAQLKMRRKDGTIITVLENARLVRNKMGEVLYYEGTMRDITEQQQAQEALQLSEERYRAFIQQSMEAIWCIEAEEPISTALPVEEQVRLIFERSFIGECNDALAKMYGYDSANSLRQVKLHDFIAMNAPQNAKLIAAFIRNGYKLVNTELSVVDKFGKEHWFINNVIGMIENKCLVRAWGTQRELTKPTSMSQEVPQREQNFVSADMKNVVSVVVNNKGELLNGSPLLESMLGASQGQKLAARHINVLGNTADEIKKSIETLKQYKHCHVVKIALKRSDGQVILCDGDFIAEGKRKNEIDFIAGTLIWKADN
ncbi:MAG TPA: PAS domain S-box protein [Bacteroidota bacterium]|nr:PAS domain S-box protein [Bacteroidota bacterium]